MRRRQPTPQDPYPTVEKLDERLSRIAALLHSDALMPSYVRELRAEADKLLDRRLNLTHRELIQTG